MWNCPNCETTNADTNSCVVCDFELEPMVSSEERIINTKPFITPKPTITNSKEGQVPAKTNTEASILWDIFIPIGLSVLACILMGVLGVVFTGIYWLGRLLSDD